MFETILSYLLVVVIVTAVVIVPLALSLFPKRIRRFLDGRILVRLRRELVGEGIDPTSAQGKAELHQRWKSLRGAREAARMSDSNLE